MKVPALLRQQFNIAARCKCDNLKMFGKAAHDIQCLPPDRPGAAEQGYAPGKTTHLTLFQPVRETIKIDGRTNRSNELVRPCMSVLTTIDHYNLNDMMALLPPLFYHAVDLKGNTR